MSIKDKRISSCHCPGVVLEISLLVLTNLSLCLMLVGFLLFPVVSAGFLSLLVTQV